MGRRKPRHSSASQRSADEALENLIRQFSQPLAFLRELVQNSLDAGTNQVEVSATYAAQDGCALVEVCDTGEGMDREIIDSRLTRLFASSKEGDLTKIGKFGVGFVSVFAIKPSAVVVDTGRGGEAWRLVFRPDRSFDRLRLPEAFDGTRVQVFVPLEEKRFARFCADCLDTLKFWCKHCDIEVRFNGASVFEDFRLSVSGPQVRHEVSGTEVVVAPSLGQGEYGFYNRGLTLLEGRGSPLPGVSFKVRSRYLEHTITRDNVLQDEHYHKAMEIVSQAAYHHLPLEIVRRLPEETDLWSWIPQFCARPESRRLLLQELRVPTSSGLIGVSDLAGRILVGSQQLPALEQAAAQAGAVVVLTEISPHLEVSLSLLGLSLSAVGEVFFLARSRADAELEGILEGCRCLFRGCGLPPPLLADFQANLPSRAQALAAPGLADRAWRQGTKPADLQLAVNAEHRMLVSLKQVARNDRGLAAYLLTRACLLELGRELNDRAQGELLAAALELRQSHPPGQAVTLS